MGFNFSNPPRRLKSISQDMRAQIDEAIAAGMARKIPQGESYHPGYVWSPTERRIVLKASPISGADAAGRRRSLEAARIKLNERRALAAAERRAHAASLQASGMSIEQIAAEMCSSPDAIRKILYLHKRVSGQ